MHIHSILRSCAITMLLGATVAASAQAAKPQGTKAQPVAVIETSAGNLTCVLFPKSAPLGVANFVGLARGTKDWKNPTTGKNMHGVPLYDNVIFHRVIPEFMIQGGDPSGTGSGEIGIRFKNESWPDLKFDQPGRLAYANAGPDTNSSQFFITEVPAPFLNGKYTIFGQCDQASIALVYKIARQPRNAQDRPAQPVVIKRVVIEDGEGAGAKAAPAAASPAHTAAPAAKPHAKKKASSKD